MKKLLKSIIAIALVLSIVLTCFTGCGEKTPVETEKPEVVPTVAPIATETPVVKYTVTYSGGEGATGIAPASQTFEAGEKFTVQANTFSKKGFAFAGYWTGWEYVQPGDTYEMKAQDITLSAQWKVNKSGGGGGGGGASGGLTPSTTTLSVPSNVKYENGSIKWDAVSNATGYSITVSDKTFTTTANTFDVILATAQTATVKATSTSSSYTSSSATSVNVPACTLSRFTATCENLYVGGNIIGLTSITSTKDNLYINDITGASSIKSTGDLTITGNHVEQNVAFYADNLIMQVSDTTFVQKNGIYVDEVSVEKGTLQQNKAINTTKITVAENAKYKMPEDSEATNVPKLVVSSGAKIVVEKKADCQIEPATEAAEIEVTAAPDSVILVSGDKSAKVEMDSEEVVIINGTTSTTAVTVKKSTDEDTDATSIEKDKAVKTTEEGTTEQTAIVVSGLTATEKAYDGTKVVALTGEGLTCEDGAYTYTYDTDKTITFTAELEKANAGKMNVEFAITSDPIENTTITIEPVVATVTPVQLTIDETTGTTVAEKEFDGTTAVDVADIKIGEITGIIGEDKVTTTATASYDSVEAGDNKTITVKYAVDNHNYIAPADTVLNNQTIIDLKTLTLQSDDVGFIYYSLDKIQEEFSEIDGIAEATTVISAVKILENMEEDLTDELFELIFSCSNLEEERESITGDEVVIENISSKDKIIYSSDDSDFNKDEGYTIYILAFSMLDGKIEIKDGDKAIDMEEVFSIEEDTIHVLNSYIEIQYEGIGTNDTNPNELTRIDCSDIMNDEGKENDVDIFFQNATTTQSGRYFTGWYYPDNRYLGNDEYETSYLGVCPIDYSLGYSWNNTMMSVPDPIDGAIKLIAIWDDENPFDSSNKTSTVSITTDEGCDVRVYVQYQGCMIEVPFEENDATKTFTYPDKNDGNMAYFFINYEEGKQLDACTYTYDNYNGDISEEFIRDDYINIESVDGVSYAITTQDEVLKEITTVTYKKYDEENHAWEEIQDNDTVLYGDMIRYVIDDEFDKYCGIEFVETYSGNEEFSAGTMNSSSRYDDTFIVGENNDRYEDRLTQVTVDVNCADRFVNVADNCESSITLKVEKPTIYNVTVKVIADGKTAYLSYHPYESWATQPTSFEVIGSAGLNRFSNFPTSITSNEIIAIKIEDSHAIMLKDSNGNVVTDDLTNLEITKDETFTAELISSEYNLKIVNADYDESKPQYGFYIGDYHETTLKEKIFKVERGRVNFRHDLNLDFEIPNGYAPEFRLGSENGEIIDSSSIEISKDTTIYLKYKELDSYAMTFIDKTGECNAFYKNGKAVSEIEIKVNENSEISTDDFADVEIMDVDNNFVNISMAITNVQFYSDEDCENGIEDISPADYQTVYVKYDVIKGTIVYNGLDANGTNAEANPTEFNINEVLFESKGLFLENAQPTSENKYFAGWSAVNGYSDLVEILFGDIEQFVHFEYAVDRLSLAGLALKANWSDNDPLTYQVNTEETVITTDDGCDIKVYCNYDGAVFEVAPTATDGNAKTFTCPDEYEMYFMVEYENGKQLASVTGSCDHEDLAWFGCTDFDCEEDITITTQNEDIIAINSVTYEKYNATSSTWETIENGDSIEYLDKIRCVVGNDAAQYCGLKTVIGYENGDVDCTQKYNSNQFVLNCEEIVEFVKLDVYCADNFVEVAEGYDSSIMLEVPYPASHNVEISMVVPICDENCALWKTAKQ